MILQTRQASELAQRAEATRLSLERKMPAKGSATKLPPSDSNTTSWLQIRNERRRRRRTATHESHESQTRRRPEEEDDKCAPPSSTLWLEQINDNSAPSREEEMARRLAGQPGLQSNGRGSRLARAQPRPERTFTLRSRRAAWTGRLVVVVVCSFLFIAHLQAQAAVIRPTIFSDLPPESPPSNSQSVPASIPQQQQQQQQQQQAAAPQQQLQNTIHQQTNLAQHQQHHLHHPHQSDGPQTQKINPLKSRFCHSGAARLDHALGLQSGAIDDLSLSASSYSNEQVRPHLARLNRDLLGGAWCPMKPVSTLGQEWIQVKLNRSHVISAIETQGRFAMGSGKEFVPSYHIVYSRNNGLTWHKWKDFRGSTLLKANDDANTPVRNELSPPIVGANVIRILPHSQYLRTVCLRLELYGCQYDEGAPIAYATMNGVVEPRWGHLVDYTYDGLIQRSGQLSGGLGQLVDGVKGPDNFSFNNGFEWVGWKSMNGDVVIEFTFKTLRNFTGALFHSNNLFSSGVEVFQAVDVHYGIDVSQSMEALRDALHERERRRSIGAGAEFASSQASSSHQATVWSADVLSIEYEPDKKAESTRPVTVHLKQRLANKLRFTLKFASKWILLSEVEFLSQPVELMSLSSLNEQLTPKLMADLRQAKTYDQYVASLREHQLRRIAADEYLQMGVQATSASSSSSSTQSSIDQQSAGEQQQSDQQLGNSEFQPTGSPPSSLYREDSMPFGQTPDADAATSVMMRQPNQSRQPSAWLGADGAPSISGQLPNQLGVPATNPMLANQPPNFLGPAANFVPQLVEQQQTNQIDLDPQQQQQRSRTIGLATVISFVFVGVLGFMGILFAFSSYRLRCRSVNKLEGAHHLQRHLHAGATGPAALAGKGVGFMSSVFAAAATPQNSADSSAASSADSSAGSLHTRSAVAAANYRHHMTLNSHLPQQQHQQQHQSYLLQQPDSHYNPLFASTSGRSSEGSLKKSHTSNGSGGPLSTLKKFTSALTSANNTRHNGRGDLLFGHHHHQTIGPTIQQPQNQLLVSLKDSISGSHAKTNGKSQAVSTQLIVGLNQANPLAHQQIYNQQAIYGLGANQQQAQYNSTANSMSLTSSSTLHGIQQQQQQQQQATGDYSLTASGDYATPDLQPIIQTPAQQSQRPFAPSQLADAFSRSSTRNIHPPAQLQRQQQQQQQQQQLMMEHNYEQISGEQLGNPMHSNHLSQHQRTLSSSQQQQQQAICQQAFNSMTLNATRARQLPQQQQESSHYYYADTEAAKSCLAGAK